MRQAIRALSVAQPWAECIVGLGKNVENRSWETHLRGWIAIHASAYCDVGRFDTCEEAYGIRLNPDKLEYGAVVGFAELVDVITTDEVKRRTGKWFVGPFGFVLENAISLRESIPCKGALKFWGLPPSVQRRSLAQLTKLQSRRILDGLLDP